MSQTCFFNKPLLKPDTQINSSSEIITLSYREDSFSIESVDKSIDSILLFLKCLDGTKSIQEISETTEYSEEEVVSYINVLDKELLILEGEENLDKGISGKN